MKKKLLYATVLSMGILGCSIPILAAEETEPQAEVEISQEDVVENDVVEKLEIPNSGWNSDEKGWTYVDESGNLLKDCWEEIEGEIYHFNQDGYMSIYWQEIDGGYYWFGNDGVMRTGWQEIWDKIYYLGNDGVMCTGWKYLEGNWYYFGVSSDGAMKTYWQEINGTYYWLGNDGVMRTGWQEIWGKRYYLGDDGAMRTYWSIIDGNYYWFASDGAMKKDWKYIWGKCYYLGNDGVMRAGWQEIDGETYYLGEAGDGAMRYGWQYIDESWYYFGTGNDGAMKTYWQEINGIYYWLGNDGVMGTNWQYIWGKWYYLGSDGAMRTGLQIIDNDVYVLGEGGDMVSDKNYNFNGGNLPIGKDGRVQGETASAIKKAYSKLNQVDWDLRKAFNWSAGMEYYRMQNYGIGPEKDDIHSVWYANYGFDNKRGNCYVMASTFCYMARLLGYKTYYVEGQVPLASGGMGPHGWCEIVIDGFTYVFDPDFTNNTGRNGFQIYYGMSGTWRYSNYKRVA